MNYPVIIAVLILVAALLIYLIKRNQKDKKEFEEEVLQSETPAEDADKENL
ncbi:FeoB-associated Cys-rich membrane protein [Pedobacter sp. BMA]|uniref:FeoB-associated Cys-rich membrane protein n=1 Tax=Pedobacter sp. BMA TaxID=1663685 RepID=UPI000A4A9C9F|nr:FeoB-associated Cys-rich membrane protein [Pedobacter sp. BMA]